MRVAIPFWQGRVSPVFDVAHNLLLAEVADGQERSRQNVTLESALPQSRSAEIAALGVEVLICGAISRAMETALVAAGIKVIPKTCGHVEQVLAAFIQGRLTDETFLMPGCCGRGRWRQGCGRGRRRGFMTAAHDMPNE